VGNFAIASLMKFLPIFDGGVLVTRGDTSMPEIVRARTTCGYEVKALVDIFDCAAETRSLRGMTAFLSTAAKARRLIVGKSGVAVPAAVEGGFDFDPRWLGRSPAYVSRIVAAAARRSRVAPARRENYAHLARLVRDTGRARVLFPELAAGTVPYMVPILFEDAERTFARALELSIQVFRWEFTEAQECPTTRSYARALLQFPCHQALAVSDLDRIAELIFKTA
jgi:dTDP-4-amino-4,6-dideoxygalactose transaminase